MFIFQLSGICLFAQGIFKKDKPENDTTYHITLDIVNIIERSLINYNYNRYERIVGKIYPIADTALQLLTQVEQAEGTMKKKEAKKYKKSLEKELKDKFEDRLKNMSRTEGTVLIEIIERNSGRTMYSILKDVQNGTTAFFWQNLSRVYGYDLKDGYEPESNPMLEAIISNYEDKHSIHK